MVCVEQICSAGSAQKDVVERCRKMTPSHWPPCTANSCVDHNTCLGCDRGLLSLHKQGAVDVWSGRRTSSAVVRREAALAPACAGLVMG